MSETDDLQPEHDGERRCKGYLVARRHLWALMVGRTRIANLPEGARVLPYAIHYEAQQDALLVVVWHKDFPPTSWMCQLSQVWAEFEPVDYDGMRAALQAAESALAQCAQTSNDREALRKVRAALKT